MSSKKTSKDRYYSKHIIESSDDLEITNPKSTVIVSQQNATDLDSGSLKVNGGVSIKRDLLVGGSIDTNGSITVTGGITAEGNSKMSNLEVDDLTIVDDVTFPDTEIFINDLKVDTLKVEESLQLNEEKHISFKGDGEYTGRRYFGWQSFAFAKGAANDSIHPYSFDNHSTTANVNFFNDFSSHIIGEPDYTPPGILSFNVDVAGIDEDGVYMPPRRPSVDTVPAAWVVLEICLNTYFPSAGASNFGSSISIDQVILIFKDTKSFKETHGNYAFCQVEVLKRPSLGIPGDLELEKSQFLNSNTLNPPFTSAHIVNLDQPLGITNGNLIGNLCTLRVNLFNDKDNTVTGPRFIGAYVRYSTNQITPS